MGGCGAIALTVAPNGIVLTCPTARINEGLFFENVREESLRHIWYESGPLAVSAVMHGCPNLVFPVNYDTRTVVAAIVRLLH